MSTNITSFLPWLRIKIGGVDSSTMKRFLILAARQFCLDTNITKEDITISPIADTSDYAITLTDTVNTEALRMLDGDARYSESPSTASTFTKLAPTSEAELDTLYGDDAWREHDSNTPTMVIFDPTVPQVTLYPTPATSVTNGVKLRIVIGPAEAATVFDDKLYRVEHRDAIIAKAAEMLYSLPESPWIDLSMASIMAQEYVTKKNHSKLLITSGYSNKRQKHRRHRV